MTMVGGDIKALNASLASEWGTAPVGNQYNFEDSEVEWIGKAFTPDGLKEAGLAE